MVWCGALPAVRVSCLLSARPMPLFLLILINSGTTYGDGDSVIYSIIPSIIVNAGVINWKVLTMEASLS